MARHRAYKPVAKDLRRRRRRWLNPGPEYACYPDSTRPILNFRPGFPPDINLADLNDAQAPDGPRFGSMLEPEAGQATEPNEGCPIHSSPEHHRDSGGPKTMRATAARYKDKLTASRTGPTLRHQSFADAVSKPDRSRRGNPPHEHSAASVAMPRSSPDGHDQELDHLRQRVAGLEKKLLHERSQWERQMQGTLEEMYEHKRRVEHLNAELTQSQIQIRALKHTISKVRTGNSSVATDSQIGDDYQYLISQLKNWVLSNFRGCTPKNIAKTLSDFGFDPEQQQHAPIIAALTKNLNENSPRKFLAIGGLVMFFMEHHVFSRFLFGMDDQDDRYFSSLASSFGKTSTPKEINFWRASTLKMIAATELHKRKVRDRKKELIVQIESILVDTVPENGNSSKRMENLKVVVDQAVNLALTLRVQRARYYLYSPHPGRKFEDHFLESAENGVDDDSDEGEEDGGKFLGMFSKSPKKVYVALTVYPALIKSGNEDGEKYDENVCVSKAKALKA